MRIFLAGGSGYVGGAVARALLAAGHTITGLARSAQAAERLRSRGILPLTGDLTDLATVRAAAAAHDVSIHAASLVGSERPAQDRAATFAMIEGARAARAPRQVIYTSGCLTLGDTGATPADEARVVTAPPMVSAYRVALEADVLAAADERVATAVTRPGMLWGGGDGIAAWLLEWLPSEAGRAGEVVLVGDGANRWSPVYHDDVGALYRLLVTSGARGLYHAVEPAPLRVIDLGRALAARTGRPLSTWPVAAARAALGPYAEALALDQALAAPRAAALGWRATHALGDEIDRLWAEHVG